MNKKSLVILSAIGALIALTGCSDNPGGSETVDSSASASTVVTGIVQTIPSYAAVGSTLNLDDYITINLEGGATSKDYEVSLNNTNATLEGHNLTLNTVGSVRITITAGERTARANLDIRSEDSIAIVDWFTETGLNGENASNFTLHLYDVDPTSGQLAYAGLSFLRTEDWAAAVDITDPTAEQEESVLAFLADGKAYWGGWDANGDLYFQPGDDTAMYHYYYFTMPWEVDGASFEDHTYTDETTGDTEEYIAADASASEAILDLVNGWGSRLVNSYGAVMDECQVMAFGDLDGDEEDELLLLPTFYITTSAGTALSYYAYILVDDIGTTSLPDVDAAIVDENMVPEPIDATPVVTEFNYLAQQTNFTVNYLVFGGLTSEGRADLTATGDGLYYLFGQSTGALMLTHQFTTEGVVTSYREYDPEAESWALLAQYGYFNASNGAVIGFSLEEDGTYENTPVTGATTFANLSAVVAKSPAAVTANDWLGLNYTGITTDETYTIFTGAVGNDDGTTKTNGALQGILNGYDVISMQGTAIGDYWCEETDGWSGGSMAALSHYWTYEQIAVNSAAHGVSILIEMQFPFSDISDTYAYMSYEVGAIGTTEVDFSRFVATTPAA